MKRIYKYPAKLSGGMPFQSGVPLSGKIIHVGLQNNDAVVWAVVETSPDIVQKGFKVFQWYGTGWDMPDSQEHLEYIGTVQHIDGFVWHLFEVLPSK